MESLERCNYVLVVSRLNRILDGDDALLVSSELIIDNSQAAWIETLVID